MATISVLADMSAAPMAGVIVKPVPRVIPAAIGMATLSPEFYRRTFIGVPEEFGPMIRYAWVGGSIWGAEFGGLISVVVGLVVMRANWRRQISSEVVTEPVAAADGVRNAGSTEFTAIQRGPGR